MSNQTQSNKDFSRQWAKQMESSRNVGILMIGSLVIAVLAAGANFIPGMILFVILYATLGVYHSSQRKCPNCGGRIRSYRVNYCPYCNVTLVRTGDYDVLDQLSESDVHAIAPPPPSAPPRRQDLKRPIDEDFVHPRTIREKLGMSQVEFSQAYHIDLDTLQAWESGVEAPDSGARLLLEQINFFPEDVKRMLDASKRWKA